jgi:hypothetical protein
MSGRDALEPAGRWPSARIDDVARLRAIAAARPHFAYCERTIDAPFDVVWSVLGDLECGVPQFDRYVRWIRITERDGERLKLESNAPLPLPLGVTMRFDAIYRPGWCVMRSWEAEVGMAAARIDANRTRVAHFEGSRFLGRLGRWWLTRTMRGELETLARLCATREKA